MGIIKIWPKDVHIFYIPTIWPNIVYSVFEHDLDVDKTDAVCQLVHEKLEQYLVPSKIIIYGRTIEQTKELSQALGCHKYYCEVSDQTKKENIIGHWQHGDGQLIVATNTFGLGINAPNVQVIVHIGAIYQMWSYSQESGRGGQDGQQSEAIMVMPARKQEAFQKKQAQAQARTQPWNI